MPQNNATLYSSSERQPPGGAGPDWKPVKVDEGIYAWMPPNQVEAFAQRVALSQGHIDINKQPNVDSTAGGKLGPFGRMLPQGVDPQFQRDVANLSAVTGIAAPILLKVAGMAFPPLKAATAGVQGIDALAGLFGSTAGSMAAMHNAQDAQGKPIPPGAKAEELLAQTALNTGTEGATNLFMAPAAERMALNRASSVFRNTPGDVIADVRVPGNRASLAERSTQLAKDALDQKAFPFGPWKGRDVEAPSTANLRNLDARSTAAVNAAGASTPGGPAQLGVDIPSFIAAQSQGVEDAAAGHGMSGLRQPTLAQGRNIRASFLADPSLNPGQVSQSGEMLGPTASTPATDFQTGLRKLGSVTDFLGDTSGRLNEAEPTAANLARQATYNAGSDALAQAVPGLADINAQYQRTIPVADAMRQVAKKVGSQRVGMSEAFGVLSPAAYAAAAGAHIVDPTSAVGIGSAIPTAISMGLGAREFLQRPAVAGNLARSLYGVAKSPFAQEMATRGVFLPVAEELNSASGQPVEKTIGDTASPGGLDYSKLLAAFLASQKQGGGQ
jgi:hypothetical protein